MLIKEAEAIVGKLSNTSKMPCRSYNTSAFSCKRGGVLSNIEGSVCFGCYAQQGNYIYPNVKAAIASRNETYKDPKFVESMVTLINKQSPEFFRWFDSGDLQDYEQLHKIVEVVLATPNTKHWLPTRERGLVKTYFLINPLPDNLCVRISADFIDKPATTVLGFPTSTVSTNESEVNCFAFDNGGTCGSCRKCWDTSVSNVCYKKH